MSFFKIMVRLVYKACSYFKVCVNIAPVWKYKTLNDVLIEIRDFSFETQTLYQCWKHQVKWLPISIFINHNVMIL